MYVSGEECVLNRQEVFWIRYNNEVFNYDSSSVFVSTSCVRRLVVLE